MDELIERYYQMVDKYEHSELGLIYQWGDIDPEYPDRVVAVAKLAIECRDAKREFAQLAGVGKWMN